MLKWAWNLKVIVSISVHGAGDVIVARFVWTSVAFDVVAVSFVSDYI